MKNKQLFEKVKKLAESKQMLPWQTPWFVMKKMNVRGHIYRNSNRWMLAFYDDIIYMTYQQAKELGGYVKPGEKGKPIIFYQIKEIEIENKETNEKEVKTYPMMKLYYVFGLSQVELPEDTKNKILEKYKIQPKNINYNLLEVIKSIVKVEIKPCCQAYYDPSEDKITIPQTFKEISGFNETLLHELIHATGHKERLNRLEAERTTDNYAKEELVAEIGAVLLANELGLEYNHNQTAAYIQGWIKIIEDMKDNDIAKIIKQAEEAVEYIMNNINQQNIKTA